MRTLQQVKNELKDYQGEKIAIMEVCGTHTSSIFKNGIRSFISPQIQLISGPGCPVCVTSATYIDKIIDYSLQENHCVLTFGDMLKVKGNNLSLTEAKAIGGSVRMLYSPLAALKIAKENKHIQFVFAAVGFETTAPIYALLLEEIIKSKIKNLKLLTAIKTIIPAITYICDNEKSIDAFLCPGHVSVITGSSVYNDLAKKYHKPFVIGGFEGEHILAAVYEIFQQVLSKQYSAKNMYVSVVSEDGNQKANAIIDKYFKHTDDYWRGIGVIKKSALRLKEEYLDFDAGSYFDEYLENSPINCRCKDVILGRINPTDCPLFKRTCTPLSAIGPCMVSTEGVCGIWYKNREVQQ
ncbi:MAG: hydrogenase formation protein HypD [Clostridia bacterium]